MPHDQPLCFDSNENDIKQSPEDFGRLGTLLHTQVEIALLTLMIHRCCHEKTGLFIIETTMRHQCKIHETLMISMQTLKFINVNNVLISETSIFHR